MACRSLIRPDIVSGLPNRSLTKLDQVANQLGKIIGQGGSAVVYEWCANGTCRLAVAKRVRHHPSLASEVDAMKRAMDIHVKTSRPDLARGATTQVSPRLHAAFDCKVSRQGLIVMEHVRGMPLSDYLQSSTVPREARLVPAHLLKRLVQKMRALHAGGLTHGDAHAGNVIVMFAHSPSSSSSTVEQREPIDVVFIDFGHSGLFRSSDCDVMRIVLSLKKFVIYNPRAQRQVAQAFAPLLMHGPERSQRLAWLRTVLEPNRGSSSPAFRMPRECEGGPVSGRTFAPVPTILFPTRSRSHPSSSSSGLPRRRRSTSSPTELSHRSIQDNKVHDMYVSLNPQTATREQLVSAWNTFVSRLAPPTFVEKDPRATVMRIVTMNVHLFRSASSSSASQSKEEKGIDGLAKVLHALQPNVFAAQEWPTGDDGQVALARGGLNQFVQCTSRGRDYGLLCASSSSDMQPLFNTWVVVDDTNNSKCAQIIRIDNAITVVNLHLDVWDRTGQTRVRQLQTVLRTLDNDIRVNTKKTDRIVIVGDLNAVATPRDNALAKWIDANQMARQEDERLNESKTLASLAHAGFIDAAANIDVSVWTGRRVDHVWIRGFSPDVVQRAFVWPTTVSDHLPLVVDLDLSVS